MYEIFFINPTIRTIIIPFPFDVQFITFSFKHFVYFKFFLTRFLQFFFIKTSSNSSPFKSLTTQVQGNAFLILLTTKISSDQFGLYPLAKMFLYFEILALSPTLNLGFFDSQFHYIQHKNHL